MGELANLIAVLGPWPLVVAMCAIVMRAIQRIHEHLSYLEHEIRDVHFLTRSLDLHARRDYEANRLDPFDEAVERCNEAWEWYLEMNAVRKQVETWGTDDEESWVDSNVEFRDANDEFYQLFFEKKQEVAK